MEKKIPENITETKTEELLSRAKGKKKEAENRQKEKTPAAAAFSKSEPKVNHRGRQSVENTGEKKKKRKTDSKKS